MAQVKAAEVASVRLVTHHGSVTCHYTCWSDRPLSAHISVGKAEVDATRP